MGAVTRLDPGTTQNLAGQPGANPGELTSSEAHPGIPRYNTSRTFAQSLLPRGRPVDAPYSTLGLSRPSKHTGWDTN